MNTTTDTETTLRPNWRHVGAFLGLTFGLTWLLDLAVFLRGGLKIPGIVATLQLQMLLPAFSAIVLGMFFFTESPIHRTRQLVLLLLPAGRADLFSRHCDPVAFSQPEYHRLISPDSPSFGLLGLADLDCTAPGYRA
jgi:hypothetical protein